MNTETVNRMIADLDQQIEHTHTELKLLKEQRRSLVKFLNPTLREIKTNGTNGN